MQRAGRREAPRSVLPLYLGEQVLEVGPVELGDGTLVLLQAPGPEVEVELRDAVLDRGPQHPAVLADEAPQPRTRDLVAQPAAVVRGDELVELGEREVRLAPDVAELEAGVAVARAL